MIEVAAGDMTVGSTPIRLSMNYRNIYLFLEKDGSVESAMFEEAVMGKSFLMYGMSFYMNRCVTTLKP